ncbi:hypothetical protein [Amycolatopsis sp. NPDC004625]|uniref:hypothetical protein n=1 Tax=Amycolatopsis sp. NPDC004625 TaxID=3154670 RepID=UPI00339F0D6B
MGRTLLVGRLAGADQFTDTDLASFAEYAAQTWRAITAATTSAARIVNKYTDSYDRLTTVLQEVTAHDLSALQAATEELHAQLPPEHWPRLAPLSTAISATRDHVIDALGSGDAAGGDDDETGPLLTHLLHTCTAVTKPLERAQQFTVHDPLPGGLPPRQSA